MYLCVKLLQIEYLFQHTNVIQISVAVVSIIYFNVDKYLIFIDYSFKSLLYCYDY